MSKTQTVTAIPLTKSELTALSTNGKTLPSASFFVRALFRMHELGIIDDAALERMLESEEPGPDAQGCGTYQALLSITLWHGDARQGADHE